MKVYISADIEGITGIVDGEQTSPTGGTEYQRARRLMTQEVNAAVQGALNAGAAEVVVNDSHGSMRNLIIEELHEEAQLITGSPKPLSMMQGLDESYDAVFFVGYHARMGSHGILSHTISGAVVQNVWVNGKLLGETGINALIAGAYGVPVVLVTGDLAVTKEAAADLGHVETVAVKEAITRFSAKCLHPKKAQRLTTEAAERALGNLCSYQPLRIEGPVTVDLQLLNSGACDNAARVPGSTRVNDTTLRYQGEDYLQAFKGLRAMIGLAR